MEQSRSGAAKRPQHWRLERLSAQIEDYYQTAQPFFVVEFEPHCRNRDWEPEVALDFAPSEFEQAERAEYFWVYGDPATMCESVLTLETLDLDAIDVLLLSPPSLNRGDAWRCERLKAVFELRDDVDDTSGWLYIVNSGAIYGTVSSGGYLAMFHARYMLFRDPRTLPGPEERYFPLPKYQSLSAVAHREARRLADARRARVGSGERQT